MRTQQYATRTVTVSASPTTGIALVYVRGAIDPAVEPALHDVVEQLRAMAPRTVLVDLAEVTFAGSTLANFVAQVRDALPAEASLAVCRPSAMTRQVLMLAGVGRVPVLDADPPPPETSAPATCPWVATCRPHVTADVSAHRDNAVGSS